MTFEYYKLYKLFQNLERIPNPPLALLEPAIHAYKALVSKQNPVFKGACYNNYITVLLSTGTDSGVFAELGLAMYEYLGGEYPELGFYYGPDHNEK